jgi:hypothetical protein
LNEYKWLYDILFYGIAVSVLFYFAEKKIKEFKEWVEGLVGFVKDRDQQLRTQMKETGDNLVGNCIVCGRLKSQDFAHCPTCNHSFIAPGTCGQKWTAAALKSIAK